MPNSHWSRATGAQTLRVAPEPFNAKGSFSMRRWTSLGAFTVLVAALLDVASSSAPQLTLTEGSASPAFPHLVEQCVRVMGDGTEGSWL